MPKIIYKIIIHFANICINLTNDNNYKKILIYSDYDYFVYIVKQYNNYIFKQCLL